jgi:hypothetical protein
MDIKVYNTQHRLIRGRKGKESPKDVKQALAYLSTSAHCFQMLESVHSRQPRLPYNRLLTSLHHSVDLFFAAPFQPLGRPVPLFFVQPPLRRL